MKLYSLLKFSSDFVALDLEAVCGAIRAVRFAGRGSEVAARDSNAVNICGAGDEAVLVEAIRQLDEYVSGKRTFFDLPLAMEGTPFQLSVWKALQSIPYGKTASYSDIARAIGKPDAVRAVGMACRRT